MQVAMFHKILDQFAGILLSAILLVVIGIFVVALQPWKTAAPRASSAKPSPTPGAISTITGTIVYDCSGRICPKDYSAYDIAAYAENQTNPTAQSPIDATGHFTMQVPAAHYTINTIPQSESPVSIDANPNKPVNVTLHIKIISKTP